MNLEKVIFENLLNNPDEYGRKVLPFLRPEYFGNYNDKIVYEIIDTYVNSYNTFPNKEAIVIELSNRRDLDDDQFNECKELVATLNDVKDLTTTEWCIATTEKFCQDKALFNAITESIKIMDGRAEGLSKGMIPQLLSEALGVTFDVNLGHDFIENADERYEFYHRKEERIPFDLDYFNKITKGGLPRKTLNVILAPTGVGKSLIMCHLAAANYAMGQNVLYISMEMARERIGERIDANLLNIPLDDLNDMPRDLYLRKIEKLKAKSTGRLIIEEYPTSCAGAANFRHLLSELRLKKNFVPDIIYIDYLNICCSSRIKNMSGVNSYTYVKSIAEELRGLAVESDVPIVSATQTAKSGFNNSDIDITDTSESMGLTHTVDMMFAVVSNDDLVELGQYLIIQLKNRYSDLTRLKRFMIGVDRPKMRLYDVEQSAQQDIVRPNPSPTFDDAQIASSSKPKFDKSNFAGFK